MSNWIPITLDTLYEAKISVVIDLCDQLLVKDETGRAAGIIQGRVDYIRKRIASHQRNQLDADPARIPIGLRDLTVDLIVARLKIALETELTKDEQDQLSRHEHYLDRIADGKEVVDAPDSAIVAPVEPLVPPPAFGNFPQRRKNELNG
jgi:hypothetical protein